MLLTMGGRELPHSHASFLLEELVVHLKICGSQANLEKLHDGFDQHDRLYRQCVVFTELISDDL
jgi:hypothetical protein